jgi:hypothetical protein
MTIDDQLPDDSNELQRELQRLARRMPPVALRARVLTSLRAERTVETKHPLLWRAGPTRIAAAAVLLIGAAIWSQANSGAAAHDRSDAIARDLATTTKQLEEMGLGPREARRSAVAFYVDTKLPRLFVPQRAAFKTSNPQQQSQDE